MKTLASDNFHPVSVFVYSAALIIIGMALFNPMFIAASVIISLVVSLFAVGLKKTFKTALFTLPIAVIIAIFNPLISHGGRTLLFYIFDTPITFEALFYGICSGGMLFSIIMFFSAYNRLVSPDKFLFIFAKAAPAFAMVVTMTQRFIPLFTRRFKTISAAQKTLGEKSNLKTAFRENSMLILWSMEEGLETADSMKARGYGAAKRSKFSVIRFALKDGALTAATGILTTLCFIFYALSNTTQFYPTVKFDSSITAKAALIFYIGLGAIFPLYETIYSIKIYLSERKLNK